MAKGKKVVIIGCGIGGSAVGALLAQDGFEVEIFEKTKYIGGRFASYKKGDFRLDVGCHVIGNCDKGIFGTILEMIGEKVEWAYAKHPGPTFIYGKEWLKFPSGALQLGFGPEELAKIMQLYQDLGRFKEEDFERLNQVSLADFLKDYLDDMRLRTIYAVLAGAYFVTYDFETPAGDWARCQQEIAGNMASGYPIGGTGAIPEAFVRSIEKRGGEVHLNQPVEKIRIENGRATGIILPGGKEVPADIVISNADIKTSVLELAGEEKYQPAFAQKVKDYAWSEKTFLVKVALDKKITKEKLIMYMNPENLLEAAAQILDGDVPEKTPILFVPIISNLDQTSCPEGKQLIMAGTGCRPKPDAPASIWKRWEDSCLNVLYEIFPEMKEHIIWVESTSPKWIGSMFGEDGCVIGVGQTLTQVGPNRPPIVDPVVKNLYHCSADSGVHGIGGELASDAAMRLYRMLSKS
jgi:prolycopene isomerase